MVWYADTMHEAEDKLLAFKSGKIFAFHSLINACRLLTNNLEELVVFENLAPWLFEFKYLPAAENTTINVSSVLKDLENNSLTDNSIEELVNFVNIVGDFMYQDCANSYLKRYTGDKLIRKVWEYFYEIIFWPRFNDAERFAKWKHPALVINREKLLVKVTEMITAFEANMNLMEE
ncbi:hypothetical protein Hsw_1684 [Hymenobacter swuensis DY53]|uniref:Uncharacterized protein n=2 Tax=Hymenobacter TaxID=89966 RepID=W8EVN0_9BACT|nr:hypothetical protein Hsw_1684 [Hymenobacter swuensis DY53]